MTYICFTQRVHSTDYWCFKRDNWEEDSKHKYLLEVKNVIRFLRSHNQKRQLCWF